MYIVSGTIFIDDVELNEYLLNTSWNSYNDTLAEYNILNKKRWASGFSSLNNHEQFIYSEPLRAWEISQELKKSQEEETVYVPEPIKVHQIIPTYPGGFNHPEIYEPFKDYTVEEMQSYFNVLTERYNEYIDISESDLILMGGGLLVWESYKQFLKLSPFQREWSILDFYSRRDSVLAKLDKGILLNPTEWNFLSSFLPVFNTYYTFRLIAQIWKVPITDGTMDMNILETVSYGGKYIQTILPMLLEGGITSKQMIDPEFRLILKSEVDKYAADYRNMTHEIRIAKASSFRDNMYRSFAAIIVVAVGAVFIVGSSFLSGSALQQFATVTGTAAKVLPEGELKEVFESAENVTKITEFEDVIKTGTIDDIKIPELKDIKLPGLDKITIPDLKDIAIPELKDIKIPELKPVAIPELVPPSVPPAPDISIPDEVPQLVEPIIIPKDEPVSESMESEQTQSGQYIPIMILMIMFMFIFIVTKKG